MKSQQSSLTNVTIWIIQYILNYHTAFLFSYTFFKVKNKKASEIFAV